MDENVDVKKRLIDALRKLDTVMVTTFAENGTMHARPMVVADIGADCGLWFITAKSSEKTHEVQTDSRAVVTGQGRGRYVSVSGKLDVIEDPEKVRALWKETWQQRRSSTASAWRPTIRSNTPRYRCDQLRRFSTHLIHEMRQNQGLHPGPPVARQECAPGRSATLDEPSRRLGVPLRARRSRHFFWVL